MQKAGYCSACNENVYLSDSGECAKAGHPSNCITGVYEVNPSAEPAATAPTVAPAAAYTPAAMKPSKPFYKKWWVWVIAVLLLGAIASAGSGGSDTPDADTSSDTEAAAPAAEEPAAEEPAAEEPAVEEEIAKIGDPLKVGDLVFTVNDAEVTTELTSPLGAKTGNWMLVTVTVKNESKEAIMIDTSFFKLLEPDGTEYETDSDNLMYIDTEQSFFLENINPKLEKQGQVLFAIPEGITEFNLQVQTGVFGTETGEIALQ
jgi:hypothetical protein